ncbi:hypothetical protein C7271_11785 [filamentous cyanobacterium CCP5]|nr:hypothetical protein C7271_11785 [filamentous cyanobacterium CCP5]
MAIATLTDSKEVTIRNAEGQQLVVLLPERQGFLCTPGEAAQPVDLSEAYYFNLLRAGLNALELRQKTRLLLEKDELLAEKDDHIATLSRQVALLEAKLSQLTQDQKQQFQKLQVQLEQQETNIQSQEAHIAQMQAQLPVGKGAIDPQRLKQEVRQAVGDKVWYCLSHSSQKDFYAAFKHQAIVAGEEGDTSQADYSEAGLRLAFVVERELIQPFFTGLYDFLLPQGVTELGGVSLAPQGKYTLGMLPPLVANSWKTLKASALKQTSRPPAKVLYSTAKSGELGSQDRVWLTDFLSQWEHPAAQWMQAEAAAAAAMVDQIAKLRNRAAHGESSLIEWQYQLLGRLVMGEGTTLGLFQKIYGVAV